MLNTEQTLRTAIAELRCIDPSRPASIEELHALSIARTSIDELLRSCVEQLRTDQRRPRSWSEIAYGLGEHSPAAARRRFDSRSATGHEHVAAFWSDHVERFESDFLPIDFLHALYGAWGLDEGPRQEPITQKLFSRRLRPVATASGWTYTRSRSKSEISPPESLRTRVPGWAPGDGSVGVYGVRRPAAVAAAAEIL